MANRWLFAGADLGCIRVLAGTPTTNTSAGTRNGTYSDSSIFARSDIRFATDFVDSAGASDAATTGERLEMRFYAQIDDHTTNGNFWEALNGSDQPWLAIRSPSSGVYGLYYNSNTGASPTWTLIGSTTSLANGNYYFNVWITLGSPHDAGWAVNDAQIDTGTFTQASLTSLDAMHFRGLTATTNYYYSEMMAAIGINLIGGHVFYGAATGAGSNSAWGGTTGTYADIDDVGINDADSLSSGSAGQRSTFAYSNLPSLAATEEIGDLFMWTRAKNDGSAPTNVKPVRRDSGGTDNVGSSFSGISTAYQSFLTRYSGIDSTEYNASEFGVESAA